MRRLNGKLLLILLASATLGGALVHGLHAFQVQRHSGMFLREADRAEQSGHFNESADDLRRYLLLVPDDVAVTARLANLLFQHHQDRQAQLLYSQVVHRQPSNDEARRRLVEVALRLNEFQDAKYQLEGFLLKLHPQEGELYFKLGSCQETLGDFLAAKVSYETAIRLTPELTSAYRRLADLLVARLENGAGAVSTLDAMIARNPQSAPAYLLRAAFLQMHAGNALVQSAVLGSSKVAPFERPWEMLRRALADAKAALERSPNDAKTLLFASQAALAAGSLDEARDFADRACRNDPAQPMAYVLLASNDLRQDRLKGALDCLKRGLEATKEDPLLVVTLANLQLDAKDVSAARPLIDRLRKIETLGPVVRYFDTRILVTESKWAESARRLHGMSTDLVRWPQFQKESLYWLAYCYERLGRTDLRLAAYRNALEVDPLWLPARLGLAETLRAMGRTDDSLVEYQRVMRLPNAPVRASMARLRLAVAKNLSMPPNERSWGAIKKEVAEVARQQSKENSRVLNAEVEAAEGKLAESRQDLHAAITANPRDPNAWSDLVALEIRSERWEDADNLLRQMQKQFNDGVEFRLAKAEYLLRRVGEGAKNGLRALADAPQSYSASDRIRLAGGLAQISLAIRDYEQAERLCRIVAQSDPSNLGIRLALFDLARQAGRLHALERALSEVRAIEQDGPYTRYGEAVRLFLLGRKNKDERLLDQALERAADARLQRPGWSRAALLIAEINDARGRRDAAVEAYSSAVDLGERDPRVVARLVSLLFEQANFSQADSLVKKLQDEKAPFSTELARLASQTSVQTGDFNRALALARQTAGPSKNVRDRIWLGQVLAISGHAAEAEATLQKATTEAPTYPPGWIELIQFYKMTGKTDAARKTLAAAKTHIDARQTPLALAYACELVGESAEAEHDYVAAMKAAPRDQRVLEAVVEFQSKHGKLTEADALLRGIIKNAGESKDQAALGWARRKLAGLLINAGNYSRYREARSLIDKNIATSPGSEADRRMSALVDASFPRRESLERAVQQLEALSQRPGALSLDDQLLLARLYRSTGERTKAMSGFRTVATQGKSAVYTLAYVEALLDQKQLPEAETWLRRLDELAPNQFGPAVARARLLAAQDRYDNAFECLRQFIETDTADPATRLGRRRLASARLEQFGDELARRGRTTEAQRFFTQAESYLADPKAEPNQPRLLNVLFLIRRGRNEEAVAEFERIRNGKDAEAISRGCLAISQLSTNERPLLERAERLIEQVANERPSTDAWAAMAALQDRLEHYDAAEQSYRRVLARASTRIDALNNLAYLLALRKKDLPEARRLVDQAIEQAGPRGAIRDSRAMVELAFGDADAALSDSIAACSDDPSALHLFHQALVHLAKGERTAASAALKKARDRGLTSAALHPLERPALRELETQLEVARQ